MSWFHSLIASQGSTEEAYNPAYLKEYRLTKASLESINLTHGADIDFERTDSFTLAIYCKWPSSDAGSFVPLFSKTSVPGVGFVAYKDDTEKLYFNLRSSPQQWAARGQEVITANQWHLLVFTYNGVPGDLDNKFYVDGRAQTLSTVTASNFTTNSIKNTGPLKIGARDFSAIYGSLRVGFAAVWNRVLNVNEVPDTFWNGGNVVSADELPSGLVRFYNFNSDTYSGSSYAVVDKLNPANNGTTTNMSGAELVAMNSVEVSTPLGIVATPRTSTQNTIFWNSAGLVPYDIEVSDDGATGWTDLVLNLNRTYYHHTVGTPSTIKFYRVKANGNGVESSYSSVVSATTLSSSYADTHYFSTHGLGDNSYNFGLSVETLRVAPCGYYDSISNKTYFVYMTRAEAGYDMTPYAYYYDHATERFSEAYYVGVEDREGQDRHPMPAIMVNNDGYVLVAAVHFHNAPIQIWKSNSPGSVDGFTNITEMGVICDYPEFRKMTNGDIYIFHRYYVSGAQAGIGYFKSTDGGATWGSQVKVLEYTYSVGRTYPTMPPQPNTVDRIHICVDVRNDTGGPFPADPDKIGYWKDMGYMYSDDGLTWRNVNNSFSKQVVSGGFITTAQWTTNYQFLDSVGTVDAGLAVSIVTPDGKIYVTHYKDDGTYNAHYHNGTSWVTQLLTFPDVAPDFYAFGYQGIQVIRHISGDTFDIYATKTGLVKRYRTTDKFATLTLADANVLPTVGAIKYERGTMTHNIYEAAEPFLFYSLKVSVPTPLDTSPGAWSDIVLKPLT